MQQEKLAADSLAAVEIEGLTRSSFILKGAIVAGSVYGAAAVGPFVKTALAQTGGGDVEILNFALTLEYLEAAFYVKGATLGLSGEVMSVAREIGANEQEHVEALSSTITDLGGTPAKKPTFMFPVTNQKSFLRLAQTLEDTGVSAYNGAAPGIESMEVLSAAGSIVQVEARHAARIRMINGNPVAPVAFDKSLDMAAVLAAVKPLIRA